MQNPETCEHEWRRVFPRHVTSMMQTDPNERVLAVLCCKCGRSPVYWYRKALEAKGQTQNIGKIKVVGDWPDELKITDYEWGDDSGPLVRFEDP